MIRIFGAALVSTALVSIPAFAQPNGAVSVREVLKPYGVQVKLDAVRRLDGPGRRWGTSLKSQDGRMVSVADAPGSRVLHGGGTVSSGNTRRAAMRRLARELSGKTLVLGLDATRTDHVLPQSIRR